MPLEIGFRRQDMMVIQVQLTKRQGAVPITRDYITQAETRLRAIEGGRPHRCDLPASESARRLRSVKAFASPQRATKFLW